jgi:hypothetical protein
LSNSTADLKEALNKLAKMYGATVIARASGLA